MSNILLESYNDCPSLRLVGSFFNSLKEYSEIGLRIKLTRHITKSDLEWCDILVSLRGANKLSKYLAEQAVKNKKYLILCIDDDLLHVPYPDLNKIVDKENKASLQKIINIADSLIVPSTYLGKKYSKEKSNYCVINTALKENEIIKWPEKESGYIKIIYAAHPGHKIFYEKYILPNMGKLYERYGDRLSYHFIGPQITVDDSRINVKYYKSMTYDDYHCFMKKNQFDIGVAPLFDTEVCRCKYFNKYIEYSKFGICGLYSNVLPYTSVVKNETNGLLVDNSSEAWYVALCKLIDSKDLRETLILNAQQQIKKEHNLDYILAQSIHDLPQMISYISPKRKIKRIRNMYLWFLIHELRNRYIYQ